MSASQSLSVLVETIDSNRTPRKALADEIGATEQAFSKMLAGVQAFGIDAFGRLPRDVQVAYWKRYGRVLGLEVRDVSAVEQAEEIVAIFHSLVSRIEKLELVKPRMAKATEQRTDARKVG